MTPVSFHAQTPPPPTFPPPTSVLLNHCSQQTLEQHRRQQIENLENTTKSLEERLSNIEISCRTFINQLDFNQKNQEIIKKELNKTIENALNITTKFHGNVIELLEIEQQKNDNALQNQKIINKKFQTNLALSTQNISKLEKRTEYLKQKLIDHTLIHHSTSYIKKPFTQDSISANYFYDKAESTAQNNHSNRLSSCGKEIAQK